MNSNCGIYSITSPSGKQYIGQAVDFKRRWTTHRWALRHGRHHCKGLQRAYVKYGPDALVFAKIAIVSEDQLDFREQEQIDARPRHLVYNHALDVSSPPMKDKTHTKDALAKMSAAAKGRVKSAKARALLSAALKGRVMSPETRARMSAAKKNSVFGSANNAAKAVVCLTNGMRFDTAAAASTWLKSIGKVTSQASAGALSMACSGKIRSAYGLRWKFEKDYDASVDKVFLFAPLPSQKIEVICIETRQRFESYVAAKNWLVSRGKVRASPTAIAAVCKGEMRTAYGFSWRLASDDGGLEVENETPDLFGFSPAEGAEAMFAPRH